MDDFLYKLRNSRKKTGYDRNRRNQDNYSPRADRSKPKGKKPQNLPVGVDHLSAIRRTLETIAENQKQMLEAELRRRDVEERKARALEDIARLMGRREQDAAQPVSDRRETPQPREAADADADAPGAARPSRADRERILKIIHGLREKGQTYEGIARHLETQNIPTLSGRGKWRGQTIYRLYKESV